MNGVARSNLGHLMGDKASQAPARVAQPQTPSAIGARIREERIRLGQTQLRFADAVGCSKSGLLKWEKGECTPNALVLAVCAELGVDLLYVVTGRRAQSVGDPTGQIASPVETPSQTGTEFARSKLDSHGDGLSGVEIALADRGASTGLKIDPAILLDIIADQARSLEAALADHCRHLLALVAEAE